MRQAHGEILLMTDVRQRLDTNSLRFLDLGLYCYELWIRKRLSQIVSIFGATGALYAIRRDLVSPIPPGSSRAASWAGPVPGGLPTPAI